MGTDFFDDLGETLSRTAREFGERAESLYETQKLRGKISSEERAVSRLMADLGKTLYRMYLKGGELTEEQLALCGQIDRHKDIISRYKAEVAGKKGKKICPCCGESVDKYVAFCPFCGAACPTQEHEEKAGDTVEHEASEEAEADETVGENAEEPMEEASEAEEETVEEASEEAEGPVEETPEAEK